MKIIKKTLLIYLLLTIANFSLAQENTNPSNSFQLRFYIDSAGFKDLQNEKKTYQEIYISFPNYQLFYVKKDTKFFAAYQLSVSIKDSTNKQIAQKEWQNFNQIDSLKQADELTSLEITGFLLTPGNYFLQIVLTDLNANITGCVDKNICVADFSQHQLQLSEIEFARSIQRSQAQNKFVKNKIEVIPNPSRVFGIESPFVYFYAEVYNLSHSSDNQDSLTREFSVRDIKGNVIYFLKKTIINKSTTSIWVEKINTLNIVSGTYFLKTKVTDNTTNFNVERETKFWINNPYKTVSLLQYEKKEIKDFRDQIAYIVDSNEIDLFDQLNLQGKIQYINNFWRSKSPEFRTEHLKRFYLANERFASPTIPGWKTDRGRVYIMYGPPDEIDREPTSIDTRAFEIWIYEHLKKQGRVEFVFVDLGIFSNYKLIHSNLKSGERLEIYNPDWREEIKIAR